MFFLFFATTRLVNKDLYYHSLLRHARQYDVQTYKSSQDIHTKDIQKTTTGGKLKHSAGGASSYQ